MLKVFKDKMTRVAAIIAYQHHEKFNGTGYPRGLKEGGIHIDARIVAVADVFDALTSDRIYKKAWTIEKSVSLIKEESGKHFDPKVVNCFLQVLPDLVKIKEKFPNIIKEELQSGEA